MLKACCDCIAAGIREENDAYGTQINGNNLMLSKADDRNMLTFPKKLNVGDKINVTSEIVSNPHWISFSIITEDIETNKPDYKNIPVQIDINFSNDTIELKSIEGGLQQIILLDDPEDTKPSRILSGYNQSDAYFSIKLGIRLNESNETVMGLEIGDTYVKTINLIHNIANIKYMKLDGDVRRISELMCTFA